LPVRSKTKGYTGDKEKDHRAFVYNKEFIIETIEELRNLFDNQSINSLEFTHTLRAKAFVLIDSLLTSFFKNPKNITMTEFIAAETLFNSYLETYCNWLEKISLYADDVNLVLTSVVKRLIGRIKGIHVFIECCYSCIWT